MGEIGNLFNLIFTFPILNVLVLLDHLFNDFALSIVVLTLIIRLVLVPVTLQQLKSMKANQALQPQMAELRKKYAKDQQAQARAMQALYKEYGINPLAGCLPMLIQLPVLYGLFYALSTVVRSTTHNVNDINQHLYPFIPHYTKFPNIDFNWFTFLSASWHFPLSNPDPTHVLPILAGLATFIQLRMSQPKTAPGTQASTDPTAQSMKSMQYIMPLITVFFGWTFPAGLALYWTVSSVFQVIQQFFVTGWGSLLPASMQIGKGKTAPSNSKKTVEGTTGNTYTGDRRREREIAQQAGESAGEDGESEGEGSIASKMRTAPRSNGNRSSQLPRRQRGSSASARRRGSAQKSRR
ncbi:MAG TPA: YidC/Oxa1 family membrane protein insertase [Ktedonobacteraceae bacterium]|nr:YidC/Oxa1 family membrane protein insertase [Ktedonobacteraceae bacterium]